MPRSVDVPTSAATLVPALGGLSAARAAFMVGVVAILGALLVWRAVRRTRWVVSIGMLIGLALAGFGHSPREQLEIAGAGVSLVLVVAALVHFVFRDNLVAYVLALVVTALGWSTSALLQSSDPWLFANGLVLGVSALAVPVAAYVLVAPPAGTRFRMAGGRAATKRFATISVTDRYVDDRAGARAESGPAPR
jgi:hypothetical protein